MSSDRRRRKLLDDRTERSKDVPVDVIERSDEYVVVAELPGYRKQDIDVTVKKSRVELVADPDEDGPTAGRPSVRRIVQLPEWVREKRARATYEKGVLRVRLPKRTKHPHNVDIE
ncbi:Hsp20/alpha crystallin family protein [Halobacterium zhouii]|uniref:Hsp20/alpha crystallin family protein n=1 Tax=Halobacterium zhouii TaxID=2902624 RepID=UPI001E488B44|nr:Hsp20/alpha crystallin family protein [Halobacterium zhouii]